MQMQRVVQYQARHQQCDVGEGVVYGVVMGLLFSWAGVRVCMTMD